MLASIRKGEAEKCGTTAQKTTGRRADSWPQISQSDSRQAAFASQTSQLTLIPLPIPVLGL